ncbi:hypothetical protein SAMN04488040_2432 [Sulfitobacter marinus]|uniref:50S ribosomal protein L35 n=1 Tax=Sulfitobacter marinus TaxID=394264 RepID=A0A1I6U1E1_9RHOB|nr:hypothetical protein [Sulfitobacter marinus]SFS95241.1 hypothetical protein SAMN04488040_2432 [Sulfitobacter marinus]
MDTDLALVLGLALAVLSIPSILSAFADSRSPRVSIVSVVIAGGLVLYALLTHPEGYRLNDIPDVIVNVMARYKFW